MMPRKPKMKKARWAMEITEKLPLKLYYTIHQNRHPMESI